MSYQIEEIEDIGTAFAEKLKFINRRTSADLLAADESKKVRESLLKETGKSKSNHYLENNYDLFWLKGFDWQFSELFEAAVVDTVKKFVLHDHDNLHEKLEEKK